VKELDERLLRTRCERADAGGETIILVDQVLSGTRLLMDLASVVTSRLDAGEPAPAASQSV
jgi:hypothetical protein